MAANNNPANLSPMVLVESLTAQLQARTSVSDRFSNPLTMSRSTLNYPTTLTRTVTPRRSVNEQLNDRFLQVLRPPSVPHRTHSARPLGQSTNRSPRHSSSLTRSTTQYDHFLTYLRRQSLARTRRSQEEHAHTESNVTTVKPLNSTRPSLAQQLPFTAKSAAVSSVPFDVKAVGRPLQRSAMLNRASHPSKVLAANAAKSHDRQLLTPANSMVNEGALVPVKTPYELHENKDKLSYSYVSDSGARYQGQMLSTTA